MSHATAAYVPATVANLGPGYDVLGLAVSAPGDVVVARRRTEPGVVITDIHGDDGRLPRDATENCAGIAAAATLARARVDTGVGLELHKGMPIGSGMGSSAASAAAAAFAVNLLIGSPLRRVELIGPCVEAEAHVSGRHADNVAPALLGGLIMVRSVDPLDIVRIPLPEGLSVVLVTPVFELPTREARAVLPDDVPMRTMVSNGANLAGLISACYSGDLGLLGRCLEGDPVTAARAGLIPGCEDVIAAARGAGAIGSSISGAGPSIFALCHAESVAAEVGEAMVRAFDAAGLDATARLSPARCPGARQVRPPGEGT